VNTWSRGYLGLKGHADKRDDGAAMSAKWRGRILAGIIAAQQAFHSVKICFE
jgi:hypothetical protein